MGQSKDLQFHQVVNVKPYDDDYQQSDGVLVAVYIRADKIYDNYDRKVTDILTLLGDLGGLQGFFVLLGSLIIGFIT
jgi:hypothetical protein